MPFLAVRGHLAKRPKKKRRANKNRNRSQLKEGHKGTKQWKLSKLALTARANRQIAHELFTPAKPDRCEHPKARARGYCQQRAIKDAAGDGYQLFEIPPSYQPATRHADQPQLAATARLCQQHKYVVDRHLEAIATGDTSALPKRQGGDGVDASDFMHVSRCSVCHKLRDELKGERYQQVIKRWMRWQLFTTDAAAELGVTVSSFNHHAQYYKLDEKKGDKVNRSEILNRVVEDALKSKRASTKDAISAVKEMGRLRGDVADNLNVQAAVVDLGSLDNATLLKRMSELTKQLAALEAGDNNG